MTTPLVLSVCPVGSPLAWHGLYKKDYDLAVPESRAHPAKMAWDLAFKILAHLQEIGLLQPGATVLDPMGGTGRTAIAACALGFKAVTVELEPRFVDMQKANLAYASKRLCLPGMELPWTILQGDARNLSELLAERGMVSLTNPPYQESREGGNTGVFEAKPSRRSFKGPIGATPGQIANLPDTVTVTSPPFYDQHGGGDALRRLGKGAAITEYGFRENRGMGGDRRKKTTKLLNEQVNIGLIPTSGNQRRDMPEYYLDAMRLIYAEIAKVSPVLVVVIKCPTRDGKLRRLDLDTIALMEACGYRIHCVHHAILFEEQEQGHLFDGSVKQPKGRLGFFKRLAYRRGSEIASYEHIIFGIREGSGMAAITSPPYIDADNRGKEDRVSRGLQSDGTYRGGALVRSDYGNTPGQIGRLKDK